VLTPANRSLQVPFGLREGRLYEPLQVESGLKCGCTCPGCGAPLVARHSPSGRVASNFAHYAGSDCASGFETAVHLAAKQLIDDRKMLFLPVLVARASGTGISGKDFGREVPLRPAGVRNLNAVLVEERLGSIRPDLVVANGRQKVLVEIAVTHFVDDVKLARIQGLGMPAVEIDLRGACGRCQATSRQGLWGFGPNSLLTPATATTCPVVRAASCCKNIRAPIRISIVSGNVFASHSLDRSQPRWLRGSAVVNGLERGQKKTP